MGKKSIIRSTVMVTVITFGIKLLGLVKQSILASVCGATFETDAFFVGSGVIVSLCYVIYFAITTSLLVIHTDILHKEGRSRSNDIINATLRAFIPFSLCITIIIYCFAPLISRFLAPTYNTDQLLVLSKYIKIMSFASVLWCYYMIINVVLETEKIFVPGKMQGFFQNLFLIVGALVFYPRYGIKTLIYAFIISGIAESILVTLCARKYFKVVFYRIND